MSNGWIKIHRKMVEWEWYQDYKTKSLFLHLVLIANHKDKKWQGVDVKRGQCITGRKKLASELKMGEQSIRTSLERLKSTNEVTIKATSHYSIITVVNYDTYNACELQSNQQANQQSNQQVTSRQPASNQQVTTNKKEKKEKKEKKKTIVVPDFISNELWFDYLDMRKKIKSPMTDKAQQLAFKTLERFKEAGKDVVVMVEESILKNWKSFYDTGNNNGTEQSLSDNGLSPYDEMVARWAREAELKKEKGNEKWRVKK